MIEQFGDVEAPPGSSNFKGFPEIGWGPTSGAEQFFDEAVEAGFYGSTEYSRIEFRAFGAPEGFAGFDPILQGEEFSGVHKLQEFFEVGRKSSSHFHMWLRWQSETSPVKCMASAEAKFSRAPPAREATGRTQRNASDAGP
jgi:hypothetical protein